MVLQNELAVQKSKDDGLPRVIWLPEETHSEHALQQAFIEALHRDAEAQFGADLITGDVEALKTSIHTTLKKLEESEGQPPTGETTHAERAELIYLICTEQDRKATVAVRRYLREQGFEVSLPAFEGDATAVRELHQQLMTTCDAVILFYGSGDEAWKRTGDNELRKMPAYPRDKPLLASYTYLAEPKTSDKEDLIDIGEPHVIDGLAGFLETEMAAFLRDVKRSGALG